MPKFETILEKLNKWVGLIVAILTSVFTIYFFYLNNRLDTAGKEIDNAAKRQDTAMKRIAALTENMRFEMDKKRLEDELRLKIFGEVKEAISNENNLRTQQAVRTIIDVMLVNDSNFRAKMNAILTSNPNTNTLVVTKINEVQNEEKVLINELNKQEKMQKQPVLAATASANTNKKNAVSIGNQSDIVNVDVFYLEDIVSEAEPRADKIVALLNGLHPAKYIARKRILPRSVNARPGYKIDANQLRYDPDEADAARDIVNRINEKNIFKIEALVLKPIKFGTRNRISIFVRNM